MQVNYKRICFQLLHIRRIKNYSLATGYYRSAAISDFCYYICFKFPKAELSTWVLNISAMVLPARSSIRLSVSVKCIFSFCASSLPL